MLQTFVVIYEKKDYPEGLYNSFSKYFIELDGEILSEEFSSGETDFRELLLNLKNENHDALFISTQTSVSVEKNN